MSQVPERRQPEINMDRRVDQLDAKIDRVGDRIETVGHETRTALEMLMKQQDERWKWFEQRFDLDARNQKQAIELLTSSLVKLEQSTSGTDTKLDILERDHSVLQARLVEQKTAADHIHSEQSRRIDGIDESLQWTRRTAIASILGLICSVIAAVVVFALTH